MPPVQGPPDDGRDDVDRSRVAGEPAFDESAEFSSVGWSIGPSVVRSFGRSGGRSVGRSVGKSVGRAGGRAGGRAVTWLVNTLVCLSRY